MENYYVAQLDKAFKGHDENHPLTIQIAGTADKSNNLTLPFELARIIKEWYYLNGDKIGA